MPEVRLRLGLGLVAWPGQQLVVKMGLGLSAELLPGLQLRLRTAAQLGLGPGLERAAQLTQLLVHGWGHSSPVWWVRAVERGGIQVEAEAGWLVAAERAIFVTSLSPITVPAHHILWMC